VRYDQLTSLPMRLDAGHVDLPQLNQTLAELREQGLANLRDDGFGDQASSCHYTLEMRYLGQIHECSVELSCINWTVESGRAASAVPHAATRHCTPTASRKARWSW
jgi:N-methylhydantoinase A